MIQRIQSIFLLVVVIISSLLFFLPIAAFSYGTETYIQKLFCTSIASQPGCAATAYYLGIINGVIALIALITIFLFRNRKLQIRLGNLNLVLIVAMIVLMFVAIDKNSTSLVQGVTLPIQYRIGAWLTILLIVFTFLANRFIKKDDDLVRSADRVR
jgi:hypothetical protein